MSALYIVSLAALHWATYEPRASELNVSALRVLHVLADCANTETAEAWPSHETIHNRLGISVSTVQRALKALRARGLITRGNQAAAAGVRHDRRPVVYRLDVPPNYDAHRAGSRSRPVNMVTGRTGGHHDDRSQGSRVVTTVTGTAGQHGDRQTVREPDSLESGSTVTNGERCRRCGSQHNAASCDARPLPAGVTMADLVAAVQATARESGAEL